MFFPAIKLTCAVAQHAHIYREYERTVDRFYGVAMIGSILLAFCVGVLQRDSMLAFLIAVLHRGDIEHWFVLLIWIVAEVGFLCLTASEDYSEICDSVTSVLGLQVANTLTYAGIVYLTFQRFFRLKVCTDAEYLSSWSSFLWAGDDELDPRQRKYRNISRFCYYFSPTVLVVVLILEGFDETNFGDSNNEESLCLYGSIKNAPFGFVQYFKRVVQLFAVFVNAFGPKETIYNFYPRYGISCLIFIGCVIIFGLQSNQGIFNMRSLSATCPRILDQNVSGPYVELAVTSMLSLMVILEPLRKGWPTGTSFTNNIFSLPRRDK